MKLDIQTLAFISCLTFLTQFFVLFFQYLTNKAEKGVRWWLLGSALWAIGVFLMPLVNDKTLWVLATIANPLAVLGFIFNSIGIVRFLKEKENRWILIAIYTSFLLFYYYFMFVRNDLTGRTAAVTCVFWVLSMMTALRLFFHKNKQIATSVNFTATIFLAFGSFSTWRIYWLVCSPPLKTYSDQGWILELSFIVPLVASLLWTFGFIIMMNQRLNTENYEEKEKLQLIFNTSPDAAVISRQADGKIVDVNAGFITMSGYTRAELIDNTTIAINIWHQASDREKFVQQLTYTGICENLEYEFQRKDGSLLIGNISAKIINIQSEPHIISVVHDITQTKRAEEAMRESEELYRSILTASPDDITITDLQGRVLVVSPAAKILFGYEPEYDQFVGSQLIDYIVPEERERAKANIIRMVQGEYGGPNEYHGVRRDGSIFDIEVNSGLIRGTNGRPVKMVFIVRDISERKQTEQEIQHLVQQLEIEKKTAELNANTDSLTGLANRRYFDAMLTAEFLRLRRSGTCLSLIMLDVDHFKKYNDQYGHLSGDDCLRQIGTLLKTFARRGTDIVARYGGEEFVAILPGTNQDGAFMLAEQIRTAVEGLEIPHAQSDNASFVTVSLGVATIESTTQLISADQTVLLADEAMYFAKHRGRNQTSIWQEKAIPDPIPAN